MTVIDGLVVLALTDFDAECWRRENPDLADEAHIIVANGRGWRALGGIYPTTLVLACDAARDGSIGGTRMPAILKFWLIGSELRMPEYLRAA